MSIQVTNYRRGSFSAILGPLPASRRLSGLANALDCLNVRVSVGRNHLVALCSAVLLLGIASSSPAQQLKLTIRVLPETGRAVIEGDCAPTTVWSFRDSYAGVMGLGSRVEALRLFDAAGSEISVRKIAPGQFQASQPASRFRYEITLAPPMQGADSSRVSWITSERGLLMLRDLLPTFAAVIPNGTSEKARDKAATTPVTLRLSLPEGWISHANEGQNPRVEFEIPDADIAVFAVGRNLRISRTVTSGVTLSLVTAGEWAFTDSEGLDLAAKTYQAHRDVFGGAPSRQATLILFPFPQGGPPDRWSAETRGNSVTLLTGKQPSRIAALARLSVPLTHEFLHFWVPNGLALNGDYDWFFEGFTIYQAARTSVNLGLLTFAEFLNALGRAHDASSGGLDRDRWSLVEASSRRWTGGESSVYSKSMVIAFLYDLNVRSRSRSKRSLDDVYRNIFRAYRIPEAKAGAATLTGPGSDGNEAAIKSLDAYSGIDDFGRVFVRNAVAINLPEQLAPFGLKVERLGLRTYITVSESLSRQQRDLLHELGYNDYVRSPGQRKPS